MGKWILRIVAGLVILLIVAGVVLYFTIDGLVRSGIKSGASTATGTKTELTTAHVSMLGGSGLELEGLELHNPEGFNKENFLSLDDGEIQVSLASLMSDKVVIPKLHLKGINLVVENQGTTLNLRVIQSNLEKLGGDGEQTQQQQQTGDRKQFIINEVKISDVKLTGSLSGIPGVNLPELNVNVPDITLEDVGSENAGGVVLSELVSIILEQVLQNGGQVLTENTGVDLGKFAGQLEQMGDQAERAARRAGKQVADEARGKIDQAGKQAQEQVNEGIDKATKGLENLLGGNNDKKTDDGSADQNKN